MPGKPTRAAAQANGSQAPKPGWRRVRFGDVVECVNEVERDPLALGVERIVGLEHLDPGSLHITRWAPIEEGTSFTRRFRSGQVLFGKRRAYQRKLAVADFDGICSGDILVFQPKGDDLVPELLPFIIQTEAFWGHALDTSAGSLSPRTKWQDLARYEFVLPPKDEQRRIAEMLWAADENVIGAQEVVTRLEEVKHAAFEELLRTAPQMRATPLGELLLGSPQSGHSSVPAIRDTGHYVLALNALSVNGYVPDQLKPAHPTEQMLAARLSYNDFLISRSNTFQLVGLVGIFNEDRSDVSFPDTMMRLPVDEAKVELRFLQEFLLCSRGRRQIERIAAGTSASMKKINRRGLLKVLIDLPDKPEQKVILKTLDSCLDSLRKAQDRASKASQLVSTLRAHLLERSCDV